jgi:hypothetical protein
MAYSERLNPLAERTCFSQVRSEPHGKLTAKGVAAEAAAATVRVSVELASAGVDHHNYQLVADIIDPAAPDKVVHSAAESGDIGNETLHLTMEVPRLKLWWSGDHTVRARRGRLSALSVSLCKSVLYGAFVWAREVLNGQKRRFSARADDPAALHAARAAEACGHAARRGLGHLRRAARRLQGGRGLRAQRRAAADPRLLQPRDVRWDGLGDPSARERSGPPGAVKRPSRFPI